MDATQFYKLLEVPSEVNENTFTGLKSLTTQYPWFSLAHQLLYETALRNKDCSAIAYSSVAATYATSRSRFFWRIQRPTVEKIQVQEEPSKPATPKFEMLSLPKAPREQVKTTPEKQIVLAGGDYFGSSDFATLPITGDDPLTHFIVTQPKLAPNPNAAVLNAIPFCDTTGKRVMPKDFVTETLAQVYANQQLYRMAIDTYEKLILQIPEKSVYFAAQIKELKKLK